VEYKKGRIGRVFLVRFDHGDDMLSELKKLAVSENICVASVLFLGALDHGRIVTGPVKRELPAKPHWTKFDDVWETIGAGMIFSDGDKVTLHVHGSYGKRNKSLIGCLREDAKVFITIEAVVSEIISTDATKRMDVKLGHKTMQFVSRRRK